MLNYLINVAVEKKMNISDAKHITTCFQKDDLNKRNSQKIT